MAGWPLSDLYGASLAVIGDGGKTKNSQIVRLTASVLSLFMHKDNIMILKEKLNNLMLYDAMLIKSMRHKIP